MKKKFLYIVSILVIVILAACGTAEPTMSADDIANTAIADAWLAVTLTQAALPTATSVPPTFTPEPTVTPFPTLPLLPTLAPATVAAVATTDPCNQVPPVKPQGALVNVKFVNKSDGLLNLSFGMNNPNDKGECVTYSYTLGIDSETVVTVLAGCYWGYAWVDAKTPSVARTGSTILCVTDPSKTPPIWITKEAIYLH